LSKIPYPPPCWLKLVHTSFFMKYHVTIEALRHAIFVVYPFKTCTFVQCNASTSYVHRRVHISSSSTRGRTKCIIISKMLMTWSFSICTWWLPCHLAMYPLMLGKCLILLLTIKFGFFLLNKRTDDSKYFIKFWI
jgi:hypothetical protein